MRLYLIQYVNQYITFVIITEMRGKSWKDRKQVYKYTQGAQPKINPFRYYSGY